MKQTMIASAIALAFGFATPALANPTNTLGDENLTINQSATAQSTLDGKGASANEYSTANYTESSAENTNMNLSENNSDNSSYTRNVTIDESDNSTTNKSLTVDKSDSSSYSRTTSIDDSDNSTPARKAPMAIDRPPSCMA